MVTHTWPRGLRAALTASTALGAMLVLSFVAACDKVPLTAPTGSVITLFAATNTVPLNSEVEIVVTVIENGTATTSGTGTGTGTTPGTTSSTTAGAGTPVQNGTLVSFTSTLGTIEPAEARTNNGQLRVKFRSGGQSGIATITAFSGGASGKLENLKIGTAAAERVLVSASPQTLGPSGGTSVITARVEDLAGSALAGVPVTFSTDAGTLTPTSATTDQTGVATTTLTTTKLAKVTANVAGKTADVTVNLNPRTGVTITAPTTAVSAGVPATFTVGVSSTANIRDVTIDFGDGRQQPLGAISAPTPVQHTYTEAGTYQVRAIATDSSGFSEQVATAITILPGQPPAVTITPSNSSPVIGEAVTFTANVSGATSTIISYEWNFGSGAVPTTAVTGGNKATATYTSIGSKVITVRVVQATGPSGDGLTVVTVPR